MAKSEEDSLRMRAGADAVLKHAGLGTIDDYDVIFESEGQKSIVLSSKSNPEDVVKIPFSGDDTDQSRIWRKGFMTEAKALQQLDALNMKSVDVPVVKAIGHDPDYILMTRLGPTLKEVWQKQGTPDKSEVTSVGRALAEFAVELHKKTKGMIHQDLKFDNVTRQQPDGRYGCLDFESLSPGSFETAFVGFALEEPNILPAASGRMRELTGKGLDAEKIRQEATKRANIWGGNPEVIARIEKNCTELAKADGPAQRRAQPKITPRK